MTYAPTHVFHVQAIVTCVMCVRSHMCVFVVCVCVCLRDWLRAHVNFGSSCLQPHVHTVVGWEEIEKSHPAKVSLKWW